MNPEARAAWSLLAGSDQDLLLWVSNSGRVVWVSSASQVMLGYQPQELSGLTVDALAHPADAPRLAAAWLQPSPAAGRPEPLRFRCRHAAGGYRWVDSRHQRAGEDAVLLWWRDVTAAVETLQRLEAVSAEYETIFSASTEMLMLVDVGEDGHFRYRRHTPAAAAYFGRMTGQDSPDMHGKRVSEAAGDEIGQRIEADMARCVDEAAPASYERSYGNYSWQTVLSPVVHESKVRQIIISCQDTTASRQQAARLMASEDRFRRLAENARDLVYRIQLVPERRQEYINPAIERILGVTSDEVYRDPLMATGMVHPDDAEARRRLESGDFGPDDTVVIRWFHRDGHPVWIEHKPIAIRDDQGRLVGLEGIGRDITDRVLLEQEVLRLGLTDALTGLPNRAQFEMMLREHDRLGTAPLALIMGDLNGLKMVNDGWGFKVGDELLRTTARLLQELVAEPASLCRWGGDEFAILLPGADEQAGWDLCVAIHEAFAATPDDPVRPSIALGTAARAEAERTASEVLHEAEDRMHRNKLVEELSVHSAIILSLQRTLAERTHETEEHARRLQDLCEAMGAALGLSEGDRADLALLAILHDVGKIAIPDRILGKPSRLSPDDMEIMRRHCEIGFRIASSCPDLAHIASAVLHHHERWDGQGYPQGLTGPAIPLISRILAIADAFDVMTNGRPYSVAVPVADALTEIRRCAASHFDPQLVEAFMGLDVW